MRDGACGGMVPVPQTKSEGIHLRVWAVWVPRVRQKTASLRPWLHARARRIFVNPSRQLLMCPNRACGWQIALSYKGFCARCPPSERLLVLAKPSPSPSSSFLNAHIKPSKSPRPCYTSYPSRRLAQGRMYGGKTINKFESNHA